MSRFLNCTVMITSVLVATPAFAQQGPGQQTPEQRAARFDAADADKDEKLNKAEFEAMLPERAKDRADQMWQRLDSDEDGSVTKEQFLSMPMGRRPQ